MLQASGRGVVRGMFVLGSNPVSSSPNALTVKKSLETLEHLVVVDNFLSETARLAHVVLPGSLWAEEAGTTTNLEGRVLLRHALRLPPAGARRDFEIIRELAKRLGAGPGFDFDTPEDIFNELRRAAGAVADYSGITYERLRAGEALFWPCPDTATRLANTRAPRALLKSGSLTRTVAPAFTPRRYALPPKSRMRPIPFSSPPGGCAFTT